MLIRIKVIKSVYDSACASLRRANSKGDLRIPNLVYKDKYTINGLTFVFFAMNVGKIKTKAQLLAFLRRHGCKACDPQPRHLGLQYGLDFLIMGSEYRKGRILRAGEYCLKSLTRSHPSSTAMKHRLINMTDCSFAKLKMAYRNRCACCGSLEGQPHFKNSRLKTRLEKSHMDPKKPLNTNNCIPLCSMCNQVYKNKVVFNKRGFIRIVQI